MSRLDHGHNAPSGVNTQVAALSLPSGPVNGYYRGDPAELVVLEDLVAELVGRPAWMADALCAEEPYRSLPWVAGRGEMTSALADTMRRVCARCLVSEECAEYAVSLGASLRGIWAGTTPAERDELRRAA